ncbi:hypothetical protein Emin_0970 [Elusimicrobium minutum Pei191]|uniref:DUF4406 domain-containing protein n=1 Tax=Elusimicrobium minutum (strain Pei191) TaxID=445932 RepID=B2KDC7_ELUMP|nr:DUF4406 domain-containing protein [Elusimicrobium minutum]ACC98523.1 hypothetical protein Emin_0970 [Elusimicrobium minutum Pei191]
MENFNAKIYISSAMSNKENFNQQAFFEKEAELRSRGYKNILNPAVIGQKHGFKKPYSFYMREAIKMLADADIMVVFGDWQKSKV